MRKEDDNDANRDPLVIIALSLASAITTWLGFRNSLASEDLYKEEDARELEEQLAELRK